MRTLLERGYQVYRREGLLTLLAQSINWIYQLAKNWFWENREYQPLSIDDITAEFDTSNTDAIDEVRSVYNGETEYLSEILKHIQVDDTFYDIGAHVGVHSAFAAKKAREGSVIAFEPDPTNIEYLNKNLERNTEDGQIFEIALSNEYGVSKFKMGQGTTSQIGALSFETGQYEVETAPLDGLISEKNIPSPNVIKIDVEGAESLVLEGMKETLTNKSCRVVFIEIHLPTPKVDRPSIENFDSSVIDIMREFREIDFNVEMIEARPWALHLKAQKD